MGLMRGPEASRYKLADSSPDALVGDPTSSSGYNGGVTKKRLALLDTHAILHRAYHALPDFSSSKGEPTGGLYGLLTMLMKLVNEVHPDYIIAAVDLPEPTYRHEIYKEYKGTRQKTDDALVVQLQRMHDVLDAFGIPIYSAPGFEADDIIGTIVEETKGRKDLDVIIASGDMDTLQLVDGERVRVYTLRKGLNDTVIYDEPMVKERYGFGPELLPDYKGIRGDPSDNIPGVRGIGEKGATTLITEFGSLDEIYKTVKKHPDWLEKAGIKGATLQKLIEQEEMARLSRELGRINRAAPIEFEVPKKEWKESVDAEVALHFVHELEFRSLLPRVKALLGVAAHEETPEEQKREVTHAEQQEIDKLTLAVWVLDTNVSDPTREDVERVGKSMDLEEAKKNILAELKKRDLEFVYNDIELPLSPVLRRMEQRGIKVDKAFLAKLSKEYTKELEAIAARIYKAAGGEFNIASPKQLGDVLFDKLGLMTKKKTAGGQRSTKESELQKLVGQHPIIEEILAYRELSKLLGTYIDAIPELLDKENRVHTHFIQTGAATGRLASQNPNLQNIPIKSDLGRRIRDAFVADEGHVLVSFDYSQIELRIAAFLSGDETLADIFRNGRDVHTEVASRVFHVGPQEVTAEQRRRAKIINFGILYGMGIVALQQSLGTNRADAQEFYNQYFEAFPRLAEYLEEVKASAAKTGFVETYFGRRRYLDGIKSPIPYVRAAAERMAINAPMQGTQADIIKLAMIRIDKLLEDDKRAGHLLLQVHDELVLEVEEDKAKAYIPKIKEIMESIIPEEKRNGIPFTAEGKIGKHWGQMERIGKKI